MSADDGLYTLEEARNEVDAICHAADADFMTVDWATGAAEYDEAGDPQVTVTDGSESFTGPAYSAVSLIRDFAMECADWAEYDGKADLAVRIRAAVQERRKGYHNE